MQLPEDDESYLRDKGYGWQLIPDGNGAFLVIKDYPTSAQLFDRDRTDLMVRIPAGYNNAGLDMFYVDPPLRLREGGGYPQAADHFEDHVGRHWQRFSRHLKNAWRAGIDGLPSFLSLIHRELQAKG